MVAGEGGRGRAPADVTVDLTGRLRDAYDAAAPAWSLGAERMYRPLAQALIGELDVAGRRVLDLGAGTGVAGQAALAAGARRVIAVDVAVEMLRHCRRPQQPIAADAANLPFPARSFDIVVAAFSLSHLPSLPAGLREARRVAAAIAASSFAPGWTNPAKESAETALRPFGYHPPPWYQAFKQQTEKAAGDPETLTAELTAAGFNQIRIRELTVPTGLSTPAELTAWRLSMAHVAPFMSTLSPPDAAAARQAAEQAVAAASPGPLTVQLLVTTAS